MYLSPCEKHHGDLQTSSAMLCPFQAMRRQYFAWSLLRVLSPPERAPFCTGCSRYIPGEPCSVWQAFKEGKGTFGISNAALHRSAASSG